MLNERRCCPAGVTRAESAAIAMRAMSAVKTSTAMTSANRQYALRMLKALARAIVEELEYDGKPVDPAVVARRALHGYRDTPEDATEREVITRELEDFVRDLRAAPPSD